MAWQAEVGSGTDRAVDYRDFVTKLVGFATSQKVATVVINNGGTGGTYVVGDILTLAHASAILDARFEVLTVSVNDVATMKIDANGAFALRLASATVNAGGSGYVVGDIIEVQGGTARDLGKFRVATLSGSAVATVTLFETGGAYTVAPGLTGAVTVGVGPAGFAGNDACTLDLTMQALITPLTNVAVTGGGGTGATVDITLAQTGWTVDSRNKNNVTENSITDEKQVTLVADATGFTNKPYAHLLTGTVDSGINDRYFVSFLGSTAHNPSLTIDAQPGISSGYPAGAHSGNGSYLVFPQNLDNEIDFWFSVDDLHIFAEINENPTATTDDGRYQHAYTGYGDRLKTESEDPYPFLLFGSSRDITALPSTANDSITSMAECRAPGNGPCWYYRTEGTVWTDIQNNNTGSVGPVTDAMFPFGENFLQNGGADPEFVVATDGAMQLNDNVIKRDRTSSTRLLYPVPGTGIEYFLMPLVVTRKIATDFNETTDSSRMSARGVFWIYNTDAAGAAINDFSEDFITIGTDRYRVFHNHVHTERYQYIAVLEDV